jgi:MFS family permease
MLRLLLVAALVAGTECLKPTEPPRSVVRRKLSRPELKPEFKPSLVPRAELVAAKHTTLQPSVTVGVLAVLGGVLIHLACGSMYTWGNLISYVPPHLKYWSGEAPKGGLPDATLVLPIIICAQMSGMPLGPILEGLLGPQLTAALGGAMMAAGTFLASYASSLTRFVWSYAVLFGLGVGIAYQVPFVVGARWFPAKKGLVTGAIITGMGASAFLFNILDTKMVNPLGLNTEGGLFPEAVYARWPGLLRTLGLVYAGLALTGALLQRNPPSHEASTPTVTPPATNPGWSLANRPFKPKPAAPPPPVTRSVMTDVLSTRFAVMWLMILCSAVAGLNTAGSYKTFGATQPALNSDAYLSLVGSLSAILGNAAGRFFWGPLTDVFGFKRPFMALTLMQSATMLLYARLAKNRVSFAVATVLMLFGMGGNFAMFPAQTMRVFGANGAKVYSIMFTGFGSAALLGPVLGNFLRAMGGFELLFATLGGLSLVSCGLAATL